ncbi:MAG: secretin N-terminal domain-containing protein [Legionellales bacterium]
MNKYLFVLCWSVTTAFATDLTTKVMSLSYINVNTAEQALKPLLNPGESISHAANKLIVTGTPKTLTTIQAVLQELDVPPVTFNVSIHQDQANWLDQDSSDSISYGTSSQTNAADSQSVQVMSGASAFIAMGSNVPLLSSVSGGSLAPGVSYQRAQVSQGILIEPQLQGKQVKLKIRRTNDHVNNSNAQEIDNQNVDTTTMIPLNRWVKLGSTGQADNSSEQSTDVNYNAGANYQQKGTLFIKVRVE